MGGNLSSRLKRIREASRKAGSIPSAGPPPRAAVEGTVPTRGTEGSRGDFSSAGWEEIAPLVLKRGRSFPLSSLPRYLDPGLSVLCPSSRAAFAEGGGLPSERVLLFDLETTGLSGGAGTVAFLAAFGRFTPSGGEEEPLLSIDQYLLLDYPGEGAFLDLVLAEFSRVGDAVLGTYNGRSFDMQILRTRCVMNGLRPPDPAHLDLVHAARRLWKRRLPACSLADIERGVLGLERGDDLPGSEAPDAWFDFLKTGSISRLLAVGDHNRKDLEGLAALMVRMDEIARDPEAAAISGAADAEGLALRWLGAAKAARRAGSPSPALEETARNLLESAAAAGYGRALSSLAGEAAREGSSERAAELRRAALGSKEGSLSAGLRAALCSSLATDALRRLRDRDAALDWIERGLATEGIPEGLRARLERRRDRVSTG